MEQCIFCQIVARRAPASLVYEDAHVIAFMDINPITLGHTLVIPKQHVRTLYDCSPELAGKVMAAGAFIAKALRAATGCAGLNIFVANEEAAGQEIWHLHLHLIPRYRGDGFGLRLPPDYPRPATRSELDNIAARIRRKLLPERASEEEEV